MNETPLQILTVSILIVVIITLLSLEAEASSPLNVVITYPDERYELESEVDVTVHVFDFGSYSDIQDVVLVVGETDREVNTTREGIGLFTGTIEIQEEDLSVSYAVEVSTKVKHNDVWDESPGVVSIQTVYYHAFQIEVIPSSFMDHWLRSGDTVHYDVYLTFMEEPVDPDPGSLHVQLTPLSWPSTDLQRVDMGHYIGSFKVPEGLMESDTGMLTIRSDYTWGNITDTRSIPVTFYLEMMTVWCEEVRGDQTGCTLEFHVRDMEMWVVEGAHVELHYVLVTIEDEVSKDLVGIINGTTDVKGSVTLHIEYPSIDPEQPWIRLNVYVYHEDLEQRFRDLIQIQDLPPFRNHGPGDMEVNVLNFMPLPLESPVTLEMELLDGQDLLASTQVGFSVFTLHEVITSGTSTTDPEGLLTISLITPGIESVVGYGTNLDVRITVDVDGEVEHIPVSFVCWHEMGLYLDWYDDGTLVEVEQGSPRGNLSVTLSNPEAGGSDEEAWFVWGLQPINWYADISFVERNWSKVSSMSMFGGMEVVPCNYSEGVYTADVPIPDFVPDGSQLYVVGVIESHEDGRIARKLTYVEGFSYEAGVDNNNDGETPEVSMPGWIYLIAVLIVVPILLTVIFRKRMKTDHNIDNDKRKSK